MSAVLVGHIKCWQCGRKAGVKQIQTRGHRMYISCVKECSTCMRTDGAEAQLRLWKETEFLSGVTAFRPSNVPEESTEQAGETLPAQVEPEPETAMLDGEEVRLLGRAEAGGPDDWQPEDESAEAEDKPDESGSKRGVLALVVLGVAGVAGALLS